MVPPRNLHVLLLFYDLLQLCNARPKFPFPHAIINILQRYHINKPFTRFGSGFLQCRPPGSGGRIAFRYRLPPGTGLMPSFRISSFRFRISSVSLVLRSCRRGFCARLVRLLPISVYHSSSTPSTSWQNDRNPPVSVIGSRDFVSVIPGCIFERALLRWVTPRLRGLGRRCSILLRLRAFCPIVPPMFLVSVAS